MTMTFDEFVTTNFPPEQHAIVAQLRALVHDVAPSAREAVSYDMPVWLGAKHIFAYINHKQAGVTFSFVRGVEFTDSYGLLRGSAKHARYVTLKPAAALNEAALRDYIRQAFEWESK